MQQKAAQRKSHNSTKLAHQYATQSNAHNRSHSACRSVPTSLDVPVVILSMSQWPPGHHHILREAQACQGSYGDYGSSSHGTATDCGSSLLERVAPVPNNHTCFTCLLPFYPPEHKQPGRLHTHLPHVFLGTCR